MAALSYALLRYASSISRARCRSRQGARNSARHQRAASGFARCYSSGDSFPRTLTIQTPPLIAIDGPAGAGKGTLARRIADHYRLNLLDTGLSYRAVAHAMLAQGLALDDEADALKAAHAVDLGRLDRDTLSAHAVGEAASRVAVIPAVRRALVEKQRDFAKRPPGAVLDGRDIGTVVCPEADVKIYLTASAAVRARRRLAEIEARGGTADYATILADIEKRDERDMGRADSPLKPAPDAHLLDTSQMDIEAAFLAAKALIDRALSARNGPE